MEGPDPHVPPKPPPILLLEEWVALNNNVIQIKVPDNWQRGQKLSIDFSTARAANKRALGDGGSDGVRGYPRGFPLRLHPIADGGEGGLVVPEGLHPGDPFNVRFRDDGKAGELTYFYDPNHPTHPSIDPKEMYAGVDWRGC
tara:strand:- start:58 stop:483 length:426 start_codon:yes stop_codon:yes gene_type:complete